MRRSVVFGLVLGAGCLALCLLLLVVNTPPRGVVAAPMALPATPPWPGVTLPVPRETWQVTSTVGVYLSYVERSSVR